MSLELTRAAAIELREKGMPYKAIGMLIEALSNRNGDNFETDEPVRCVQALIETYSEVGWVDEALAQAASVSHRVLAEAKAELLRSFSETLLVASCVDDYGDGHHYQMFSPWTTHQLNLAIFNILLAVLTRSLELDEVVHAEELESLEILRTTVREDAQRVGFNHVASASPEIIGSNGIGVGGLAYLEYRTIIDLSRVEQDSIEFEIEGDQIGAGLYYKGLLFKDGSGAESCENIWQQLPQGYYRSVAMYELAMKHECSGEFDAARECYRISYENWDWEYELTGELGWKQEFSRCRRKSEAVALARESLSPYDDENFLGIIDWAMDGPERKMILSRAIVATKPTLQLKEEDHEYIAGLVKPVLFALDKLTAEVADRPEPATRRLSDRYIAGFIKLEKCVKAGSKERHDSSLREHLKSCSKRSPLFRRYSTEIQEFADLRNAIIHERIDDRVIAEPHEWAVSRLENLVSLLTETPKVYPDFSALSVLSLEADSVIDAALKTLFKEDYSQAPVYAHEEFVGLLSGNAITRWMGSGEAHDGTTVSEVLKFAIANSYRFVGRDTHQTEVLEIFDKEISGGNQLEAVLITHSGKSSEKLLGIITLWDLPAMQRRTSI